MKKFRASSKYEINVRNEQTKFKINLRKVEILARATLAEEDVCAGVPIELGISFVSDQRIWTLNRKFLGHDWKTDVLAFPVDEKAGREKVWMLGEVVISIERAMDQSQSFNEDPEREVALYMVHGILHLLGYRDKTPKLSGKMWRRQDEILKRRYNGIGLKGLK
ncbi:MAG: rRNA maturation RNase YbeY [Chlamydiae bacterium]|nr:rRNA maturation RNase YbeY [Chlamydiota bacterium]MBI3277361.1 rRNA maturation RNase YbeY [Chlamydiota bacterium]